MKLKHYDHDERARFVTFCTHRHIPLLTNAAFRAIVAEAISTVKTQSTFTLLAYVIMPEHVHLVIVPAENTKVGPTIGEIKRVSAMEIHKLIPEQDSDLLKRLTVVRNGVRRFALWQRRCYDHNCRSEVSVWEMVKYCHHNPVARKLVPNPEDWRWSSCRWYKGLRDGPLEVDVDVES